MIDAAIVGIGWWGQKIVAAVQGKSTKLRFVSAVSKAPQEVQSFAAQHGLPLATDLADVLSNARVKAVVLATPHSLHTDQIIAVAGTGRAVFCEKPLALKTADALRSVEACRRAGVVLGLGTNKRFFPSMRELRRFVASGVLGKVLHIEGHYSNENTGRHFSSWRTSPAEAPGAGMTGSGIHVLDALISIAGPVKRVSAQVVSHRPQPSPLDTVTAMFEFERGISGTLGAIRSTPLYWRIHVFGDKGSAEALGETDLVLRLAGGKVERFSYDPVDSLAAEFDTFADAVAGRIEYPIPTAEMIATIAAFEALIDAIEKRSAVELLS
jgi:predicted dehydrogenase